MREVTGPIVAISLVLMAVFLPVAFLPGTTGRLYQQFALTIACSVAISALNALTEMGTVCRSSSRRLAVTMTSWKAVSGLAAEGLAAACSWPSTVDVSMVARVGGGAASCTIAPAAG